MLLICVPFNLILTYKLQKMDRIHPFKLDLVNFL